MTPRDAYAKLAESALDLPVFMYPEYLDAVCGSGEWEAAIVEKNGQIVGALPYCLRQKGGLHYVAMPLLARQMGPYLLPEYRSDPRREIPLLKTLLSQLPPLAAFEQDFNYAAANWLPFYWEGYRQTTRYSYEINLQDLQAVWQNITPNYRNNKIKRAARLVRVEMPEDPVEALRLQNQSLKRQGVEAPIPEALFRRIDQALAGQGRRFALTACDRDSGAAHSGVYVALDRQRAWLLMAGDHPELRSSGAGILLIWEAIRHAQSLGARYFDFAGSMIPAVEAVRRQFGAQPRPYLRVWRDRHWLFRLRRLAYLGFWAAFSAATVAANPWS